jgi:trehalose synthase
VPPESSELLVDSDAEMADRVLHLLRKPEDARAHGLRGREWVRQRFLLPRLVADELRLMRQLMA